MIKNVVSSLIKNGHDVLFNPVDDRRLSATIFMLRRDFSINVWSEEEMGDTV
jgi:hypothetical protein